MRNTASTKLTTRDSHAFRIQFHEALESYFDFDSWAQDGGYTADGLRSATRKAIRARHHAARILHPLLKADECHPDIYALDINPTQSDLAVYTVEQGRVVVLGFRLACDMNVPGEETIEFICESGWFQWPTENDDKPSVFQLTWPTKPISPVLSESSAQASPDSTTAGHCLVERWRPRR
jgi:hypothetical protein